MASIKDDDIVGFYLVNETVCQSCATDTEERDAEFDNVIVADDSTTDWIFCDRCKTRMK